MRVPETHPLSALARSANMFTYRKNKNPDRTHVWDKANPLSVLPRLKGGWLCPIHGFCQDFCFSDTRIIY
uniref:Uncharacterized protein n=1 Tax=Candidatus Kentrum sp. TUN TaxID=2126343 RepID=A0A450ZNA6_9GAMM|nr:MAG: hypothetical protein BECKTUN1418F_GA0071002_104212 [Candidatus Kentron sp. TUN]VFK55289.1 MAG: hypothetical protein BECKTUN1418D_GA0071000_103015 [Candidatus Kentron sp. TUN]VFK56656.1 MAG: hypothetical protein BECKTUN1418E_GA0071001_104212 [Candidatus Kentron sp. TUN]